MRLAAVVAISAVILMQMGCGTTGWSVSPYAGVNGNTDNSELNWNAGVSFTLFNKVPGPSAPGFYLNDADMNVFVNQVVPQNQGDGNTGGGNGDGNGGGDNGGGGGNGDNGGNGTKNGHGYGDKNHEHIPKND